MIFDLILNVFYFKFITIKCVCNLKNKTNKLINHRKTYQMKQTNKNLLTKK